MLLYATSLLSRLVVSLDNHAVYGSAGRSFSDAVYSNSIIREINSVNAAETALQGGSCFTLSIETLRLDEVL
jgi:hypothetical protein